MAELTRSSDSGRGMSKRKRSSIKIDMTPMVDLAFLLLTFFMLTTSFYKPFIIKVDKPVSDGPGAPVNSDRVLTLILGENNKVYWYQGTENPTLFSTNFSGNGVRKILLEKKKEIQKMVVLIKPSDQSKYRNMIDMLDEMSITNISQYFIVDMTSVDNDLVKKRRL